MLLIIEKNNSRTQFKKKMEKGVSYSQKMKCRSIFIVEYEKKNGSNFNHYCKYNDYRLNIIGAR